MIIIIRFLLVGVGGGDHHLVQCMFMFISAAPLNFNISEFVLFILEMKEQVMQDKSSMKQYGN